MSASYVVKAPYVTLKVLDVNGMEVVQGFYAGAVVENPVENEQLDKHVRTGLVEKGSEPFGPGADVDAQDSSKAATRKAESSPRQGSK